MVLKRFQDLAVHPLRNGVHSHLDHLLALIRMCSEGGVRPSVQMITDGRDTSPRCALNYLPEVEAALQSAGGSIATVMGRYYAMDRDKRWQRTEKAWRALVLGEGRTANNASEAITSALINGTSTIAYNSTVKVNATIMTWKAF